MRSKKVSKKDVSAVLGVLFPLAFCWRSYWSSKMWIRLLGVGRNYVATAPGLANTVLWRTGEPPTSGRGGRERPSSSLSYATLSRLIKLSLSLSLSLTPHSPSSFCRGGLGADRGVQQLRLDLQDTQGEPKGGDAQEGGGGLIRSRGPLRLCSSFPLPSLTPSSPPLRRLSRNSTSNTSRRRSSE